MADDRVELDQDARAPRPRGRRAVELLAQRPAGLLVGDELGELVEAQAEQSLQAQHLAQLLDVVLAVVAVRAGLTARAPGHEPDLLVVADRARRRADGGCDLTDAHRPSPPRGGRSPPAGVEGASARRWHRAGTSPPAPTSPRAGCG